jgi:hypothetical protein
MPISFDLSKYRTKNFIETGTYIGAGVKSALNAGFENIYSIELDESRYKYNVRQFKGDKRVNLILGDSGVELPKLLTNINEQSTFWIDAHYCGEELGTAALAAKWTPIKEELDSIKDHHIKNHIILIDDFRCMDNTHFDTRTQRDVGFPGKENLLLKLKEINSNYKIKFLNGVQKDDVVLAYVE